MTLEIELTDMKFSKNGTRAEANLSVKDQSGIKRIWGAIPIHSSDPNIGMTDLQKIATAKYREIFTQFLSEMDTQESVD